MGNSIRGNIRHLVLLLACLFLICLPDGRNASAETISTDDFVITVQTDNPGASTDTQFTIPTHFSETYNYNVDCDNDGIDEKIGALGFYTCSYSSAGTYTIRIKDNVGDGTGFPRIYFDYFMGGRDEQKLLSIDQWGSGKWTSMEQAFYGASNMVQNATDSPDLSLVTEMSYMFHGADSFNGDLSGWDTSNVMVMNGMFMGADVFNGDITTWNTSNVTNMSEMFTGASAFNQDISSWDTSSLENMGYMFQEAIAFNQPIGTWDTSKVKYASFMFEGATTFNANISSWDTSSVIHMIGMFANATAFNQPIGSWVTSSVTDMSYMFSNTGAFNQDISGWDVSALTDASGMFADLKLSTANYDALLNDWGAQTVQSGVIFGGGNSTYCFGEGARAKLVSLDGWTITDGGKDCSVYENDFMITVQTDNPGTSTDTQFTIPTHTAGPFVPGYALVALNPTACWALDFGGLSSTIIIGAGIFSNSNCASWPYSIHFSSGVEASIQYDVTAVGGIYVSGTVAAGEFNPYAPHMDIEQIPEPDCSHLSNQNDNGTVLQPGIYNGIHITSQDVFLEPGLYCLDADLYVQGGTITGDGVTLFMRGSAGVTVNGGNAFLTAPQNNQWVDGSGRYWNGMVIYQQYGNTASTHINENVDSYYEGTIFAPDSNCSFEGSLEGVGQDIQVVCDTISVAGTTEFVIEYNPENQYRATPAYNYNVDCDNDSIDEATGVTGDYTCEFPSAGTYTIRISDNAGNGTGFPRIYFNNQGDKDKLLSIDQWGTGKWVSMKNAFYGASNLTSSAVDVPDLSNVTDMSYMFHSAAAFDQDIGNWDVSSLLTADRMFGNASLSTPNYDSLLIGWDAQMLQSGVAFDGGYSTYCTGGAARLNMISSDSWTISDGGKADTTNPTISFISPTAGGSLMQPRALLIVDVGDPSGISKVEFYGGTGGSLHLLFTDTDGSDGWQYQWPTLDIAGDAVSVKAVAYDACGNQAQVQLDSISLTRTMTNASGYQTRGGGERDERSAGGVGAQAVEFQIPGEIKKVNRTGHWYSWRNCMILPR